MATDVVDADGSEFSFEDEWDGEIAIFREFVESERMHAQVPVEAVEERFRRCVFRLRYRRPPNGDYEFRSEATGESLGKVPVRRRVGLKANGASWEEIGVVFGCTGEAVRKRFGVWVEGEAARLFAEMQAEEEEAHDAFLDEYVAEHGAAQRAFRALEQEAQG